ncbi:MAG TPA: hypothetical protein VGN78_08630, partial [Solirubrobacteraceae bacterium]|nr:hypothetical protein [Solirubrobacteraceae bacterium]
MRRGNGVLSAARDFMRRPEPSAYPTSPATATPARLGDALLAAGLIDRSTLDWGLRRQRETGERLGAILLAAGKVHRLDLQRVLGEQWGLPFIDLLATPTPV